MRPAVSKEVSKSHEIPLELLAPNVGSSQTRDPFDLKAKQGKSADGSSLAAKKGGAKSADGTAKSADPESPIAIAAREAAARKAAAEKAAQELRDALKGLVLNGTYVSSKRSVAVICGQLYAEGQSVRPVDGKAKSFVVSKISQHKVLLKLDAQTAELSYLNPPAKSEKDKEKEKLAPAARQAVAPIQPPA
ncbi:MAG: hypothetical protein JWN70_2508 [Planctomycetaceae bacterium]|nr:hypothetical protein [Planctomycetaceae bacterium]